MVSGSRIDRSDGFTNVLDDHLGVHARDAGPSGSGSAPELIISLIESEVTTPSSMRWTNSWRKYDIVGSTLHSG